MGILRSNRGPYAPRRQTVPIDWEAMRVESDRIRAEEGRIADEWHDAQAAAAVERDPIAQLVRRAHAGEQQVEALSAQVAALAAQVQALANAMEARDE